MNSTPPNEHRREPNSGVPDTEPASLLAEIRQPSSGQLIRLHATVTEINRAIVRAVSRDDMQFAVCRALVNSGLFKMAWIGWRDPATAAVIPGAVFGDDSAYLDRIALCAANHPEAQNPTDEAIREGRTCVCNDFFSDASSDPAWYAAVAQNGFHACIALPVHVAGEVAALTVYAMEKDFFGLEEIALLDRAAADISFAIAMLDRAAERRSEEARSALLATAIEAAPNAVSITNRNGIIEWANAAFVRSSGYALQELVGKTPRILKSGHHSAEFYAKMWRVLARGRTWRGELVNRRKTGELYIEDITIVPVCDEAGIVRNFVSLCQDITGRKGAERRIREQADLLDKASEAIVVADLNHRITFWNRGAERLFGLTATDTLGKSIEEAFALDRTIGRTGFHEALAIAQDWRGEIHGHDRERQPIVIETSITMLRDDGGQPTGRLYIGVDVTRKKALEEQFLRAQRMENLGMLAAGIAHDLNNILSPIRMIGPLLRDRLTMPPDLRLLDTLENCASRGAGLVRQILGFAHDVAGEHRQVQVKHLLRDIAEVIAASFPKSIVLEEEIPAELWPVNGNPTRIHQVLLNLCVNARDAMPQGGTLRLGATNCVLDEAAARQIEGSRPGPWLRLQVGDTGTGIPPDLLSRIWEPLFTTKTPDKGTGLGLSTVRGIVVQHQGFVTVQSERGRGTTFCVYLPVDASAEAKTDIASPMLAAPARGELILFVDDEPSIRELAETVLSRHGYRVLTARDGAEAVVQFAPHMAEIALVVTDLDMPNLDGATLCRVIRALSPSTKIVATSGFTNSPPSGQAVNGFLPKPFNPGTLLAKVEEALKAEPATE